MKIIEVEQGSTEWVEARRCMITGTKLGDVMGSNLDQVMLICELIGEEGSEQTKMMKATPEMERGTEEEVFAIKHFEQLTGKKVDKIGICLSDEFEYLALSPDGLIMDKKTKKYTEAVEVKAPNTSTAVFYKLSSLIADELGLAPAKKPFLGIPAIYKWQVVNYFIVNPDLQKLHFVVYDARFVTEDLKMTVIEVDRTMLPLIEAIEEAKVSLFAFREKWLRFRDVALPSNF